MSDYCIKIIQHQSEPGIALFVSYYCCRSSKLFSFSTDLDHSVKFIGLELYIYIYIYIGLRI